MGNGNQTLGGSDATTVGRPSRVDGLAWEEDLSSSGQLSQDVGGLLSEQIADRRQFRQFRLFAFYGVAALVVCTVGALLAWIWCVGRKVADPFSATNYQTALFITPLIVLASFAALLVLALLRFAFRPMDGKEKDESPDALGVVHALGREALAVLKDYVGKKAT